MPLLRVPYTDPFPPPKIIPSIAHTASGALAALHDFLTAPPSTGLTHPLERRDDAVFLTGAGISVASGLADYRGTKGTYTLNRTYRPIYYSEFVASHAARKRYWARSFLGWAGMRKAQPNNAHHAVGRLGELGKVSNVITQNVDSFHPRAHPKLPTVELHGYLRAVVCLTCRSEFSREEFQQQLYYLNPAWAAFLEEILASGAMNTENPDERRRLGLKTNPDGDVDLPNAPYSTFRYPACRKCSSATAAGVDVDADGAMQETSTSGILKPAVIMFGESIAAHVKTDAERAVDSASRIVVVGSSLATYSAWRLVKRAKENGMPIAIVNLGGVRGEETFFADVPPDNTGRLATRCNQSANVLLPSLVQLLEKSAPHRVVQAARA